MRKGDRMIGGAVWRGATDPVFLENYMKMKADRERSGAGLFQELSKASKASKALGEAMKGGAPPKPFNQLSAKSRATRLVEIFGNYQAALNAYPALKTAFDEVQRMYPYRNTREQLAMALEAAPDAIVGEPTPARARAPASAPAPKKKRPSDSEWDVEREGFLSNKETRNILDALGASADTAIEPPRELLDEEEELDLSDLDMEGMGRDAMRNHRMIGGNLWDDIVDGVSMVFGSGRPPAGLARPVVFERPPAQYPYLL